MRFYNSLFVALVVSYSSVMGQYVSMPTIKEYMGNLSIKGETHKLYAKKIYRASFSFSKIMDFC